VTSKAILRNKPERNPHKKGGRKTMGIIRKKQIKSLEAVTIGGSIGAMKARSFKWYEDPAAVSRNKRKKKSSPRRHKKSG